MSIVILVPNGAEYRAVKRGVRQSGVQIIATPAGSAIVDFLQNLELDWRSVTQVVVMGLCGGLSATTKLGQIGCYQSCQTLSGKSLLCSDIGLQVGWEISQEIARWQGVTIDRVITTTQDKQILHRETGCDVVDMETAWVVEFMQNKSIEILVLRVVSDVPVGDLPDLSQAFNAAGELQPWQLFQAFMRQPIAAMRLIYGSLIALRQLENCTKTIRLCAGAVSPYDDPVN